MKQFGLSGVMIAIGFWTFLSAMFNFDRGSMKLAALEGVAVGLLGAAFLNYLQKRETAKLGEPADLSPAQDLELELLAPDHHAVFQRSLEAVKNFGAKIETSDLEKGVIQARARGTWQSFGEKISVQVMPVEGRKFIVKISSRPRFRGTIIDYGKGRQNVRTIAMWLGA